MTVTQLQPNEFIVVIEEINGRVSMILKNPHDNPDVEMLTAAYAMVATCKKLKRRVPQEIKMIEKQNAEEDESDIERDPE